MALADSREARGRNTAGGLRERAPSYAAALVLTLLFMGATLPSPLYVIYRDELHFSQVTLTLIYAVYFAGAMATAFFLGRISDEIGRRVAILAAVFISIVASLVFIFADGLNMLFIGRLLSGLALPLASGAGTAWIVELCEDRCTAASLSAGAILSGLGLGALISPACLLNIRQSRSSSPFIALVSLALAAAVIVWLLPETVKHPVRRWSQISLRPRIGVPRSLIGAFVAPAVTVFVSFALLGFYSALAPSLLQRSLQVESHAIGGAVIFELYARSSAGAGAHPLARSARRDAVRASAPHPVARPARRRVPAAFAAASSDRGCARRRCGCARLSWKPADRQPRSLPTTAAPKWSPPISSSAMPACRCQSIGIGLLVGGSQRRHFAEEIFAAVIAAFALLAIGVDVRGTRG